MFDPVHAFTAALRTELAPALILESANFDWTSFTSDECSFEFARKPFATQMVLGHYARSIAWPLRDRFFVDVEVLSRQFRRLPSS